MPTIFAVYPGERDREATLAAHVEARGGDPGWRDAVEPRLDASPSLRTLSEVVAGHGDMAPGEARMSRALDDRHDEGDAPSQVAALDERLAAAREELDGFAAAYVARLQAAKSLTKGCPECGSQVAVRHLRTSPGVGASPPTVDCPVCGAVDFCLPPGDRGRKSTLAERVSSIGAARSEANLREAKRRGNVVWVVCAGSVGEG